MRTRFSASLRLGGDGLLHHTLGRRRRQDELIIQISQTRPVTPARPRKAFLVLAEIGGPIRFDEACAALAPLEPPLPSSRNISSPKRTVSPAGLRRGDLAAVDVGAVGRVQILDLDAASADASHLRVLARHRRVIEHQVVTDAATHRDLGQTRQIEDATAVLSALGNQADQVGGPAPPGIPLGGIVRLE